MNVLKDWFHRYFSDPQVVILVLVLLFAFSIIFTLGSYLAPVLTAVVVAYLLLGPVRALERIGIPSSLAIGIVYILFLAFMVLVLVYVLPELVKQINLFVNKDLGPLMDKVQKDILAFLQGLQKQFTGFSAEEAEKTMKEINTKLTQYGKGLLEDTFSTSTAQQLISAAVFILLMPLLVFFLLKDKDKIIAWMKSYYPKDIELTNTVWQDLNEQIANYIRGKVFEILLVWVVTYIAFLSLGMPFPLLLAALVGFSVVIPYIGAVVVTIPVVLIAYFAFDGFTSGFWWVIGSYSLIQTIDGVVIVPLLFSEVVKLHPISIVAAVLVFGGIWGFWGVFFAIPLASLVQAVMRAWPRVNAQESVPA